MAKRKPIVGDIWRDPYFDRYWLVMEKYIDEHKNTHVLTLKNLKENYLYTTTAVYVRDHMEFVS
jgi:hypothetical protein